MFPSQKAVLLIKMMEIPLKTGNTVLTLPNSFSKIHLELHRVIFFYFRKSSKIALLKSGPKMIKLQIFNLLRKLQFFDWKRKNR